MYQEWWATRRAKAMLKRIIHPRSLPLNAMGASSNDQIANHPSPATQTKEEKPQDPILCDKLRK